MAPCLSASSWRIGNLPNNCWWNWVAGAEAYTIRIALALRYRLASHDRIMYRLSSAFLIPVGNQSQSFAKYLLNKTA